MLSSYNWFILSSVTLDKELVTDNLRDDSRVLQKSVLRMKRSHKCSLKDFILEGKCTSHYHWELRAWTSSNTFCKPFVQPCYGSFTLHGTGTWNKPRTIGNNDPGPCLCLKSSMNISIWCYTFHLVPVPVPFPCSVNTPLGWFQTWLLGRKLNALK